MIDLSFFYSAKIAVVFILVLSLATLEAQGNENDKFYDLMATIGEHFGGEFNDAKKALELDLNGANAFLEGLHSFATHKIVRKNENGEFECNESKKPDFIKAIKEILGEKSDKDVRNFLKAIIVPKQSKTMINKVRITKSIFDNKSFKKVEDLVKELSVKFSDEQLFNLLFSLAARLEALVHGKNIDGTLKEKKENSKDKIQTFLAVSKCLILTELEEFSIFDYWIEIIKMKTKNSQKPIFGVAIYKEKYGEKKSENSKEEAFKLSRENYKILKQLNDQKLSIYKSANLLRRAFNYAYTGKQKHILRGKIPKIFQNMLFQIHWVFYFNWAIFYNNEKNSKCKDAIIFQNISENLMKMISDKGIDPKLHFDSQDKEIREYVQKDVEESCKKFENEEEKIIFLNNVHYELAINFEFNQRKEVYDRVEDLLSDWVGNDLPYLYSGLWQLSDELYLKKNAFQMKFKINYFIKNTNRETISIIDALIGKEHIDQFNLGTLFDQMKTLMEVTIPEEEAKLWEAKKEINKKQLENDIKFLKNNPKSIAEDKYQKAVAIICTTKQFGEKVKMLVPKIKNIEIQTKLIELSSAIQNNEMEYFGQELCEQMEESFNQLKHKQIEMEETVSEETLLKNLQFEFNKIWNSFREGYETRSKVFWRGMEEYYLSIQLMQLEEQARTLAKTFERTLINVMEHHA